jgi:hypothetical protein
MPEIINDNRPLRVRRNHWRGFTKKNIAAFAVHSTTQPPACSPGAKWVGRWVTQIAI